MPLWRKITHAGWHDLARRRPGIAIHGNLLLALTATWIASASLPLHATVTKKTYACQPALSVFCRNIHVACAGATRIATAPFRVMITGADATLQFSDSPESTAGRASYDAGILIELAATNDWVRIEPDGRYSHRIYRRTGAAMSYGTCQRLRP